MNKPYIKFFEAQTFDSLTSFLASNKKGDKLVIPNKRWDSRDVTFDIKNMGDGRYKIDYTQSGKRVGRENFSARGLEKLLPVRDYRQEVTDRVNRRYNVDINKYVSDYYKMPNGKEYFMYIFVNSSSVSAYLRDTGKTIGVLVWDESLTSKAKQAGDKETLVIWGESVEAIQVDSQYRSQGVGENLIKFAMFSNGKSKIKVIGPQTQLGQALFKKFGVASDK